MVRRATLRLSTDVQRLEQFSGADYPRSTKLVLGKVPLVPCDQKLRTHRHSACDELIVVWINRYTRNLLKPNFLSLVPKQRNHSIDFAGGKSELGAPQDARILFKHL